MLKIGYVFICYLCIFFGKVFKSFVYFFSWIVCFLTSEFQEFSIYCEYKSFFGYVIC